MSDGSGVAEVRVLDGIDGDANAFGASASVGGNDAGLVYGHVLAHPDGRRTALLYSLDVAEAYRQQGIGRQLVTTFVDEARRRGCTEVWVLTDDANPAGLATYASAGGERDATPQVMFTWALR